jgi:hypothetical protein
MKLEPCGGSNDRARINGPEVSGLLDEPGGIIGHGRCLRVKYGTQRDGEEQDKEFFHIYGKS